MAKKTPVKPTAKTDRNGVSAKENGAPAGEVLVADIIIKNAPDPVFVSDLEGKILQANDAVSQLLGFRQDEVVEQSLSRFISEEETREFTAALREVVERGVTRNAVLNPRAATGEVIPTTLNASALARDGRSAPSACSETCASSTRPAPPGRRSRTRPTRCSSPT